MTDAILMIRKCLNLVQCNQRENIAQKKRETVIQFQKIQTPETH